MPKWQSPAWTLDSKAWVSLPGWLHLAHAVKLCSWENQAVLGLSRESSPEEYGWFLLDFVSVAHSGVLILAYTLPIRSRDAIVILFLSLVSLSGELQSPLTDTFSKLLLPLFFWSGCSSTSPCYTSLLWGFLSFVMPLGEPSSLFWTMFCHVVFLMCSHD